ncbi:MAG: carbohydrate ABC transporter permease [Myxococcota bacterium]|jgi:multiple sugar transport system permease protein|nr:carbohydrate ABC transporter permease [Myxococcota bacterium]
MSPLRAAVLIALAGFVVLYLRSPRDPRLAFRYLRWVLLLGASLLVLAPFAWLVCAVFKDKSVLNEYVFLPPPSTWDTTLNLDNFRRLFKGEDTVQGKVFFWQYVLNSVFFASAVTVVQLVLCSAAGYALAKFDFYGKRALMGFMLGSMMVPAVLLFAPIYEMMVKFGLINTYHGVVVPSLVSAYGIFLFRQAIVSVPNEMIDAGRVDGASELGIYLRLVMPLVRPMSAAFCLITFLTQWNAFFQPSIFLQSQDMLTLPVVLNLYLGLYQNDYGVFLAGTAVAIIPPAILFFALEKEFISGLTSGAVKG